MLRVLRQLLFMTLFLGKSALAQLVVNTTFTPTQLVTALTGPGVVISNITYTGSAAQAGQFTANGTNLGIVNGIMLSTASCALSIGPNTIGNASEDLLLPGDPVLDIQAGTQTFDAAILEFDFTPQNDTVSFRYVFASEEYPEYVCSVFNDAFAFQISGPGYATPTNIAFIPGTSTPVAINTINIGSSGGVGTPAPTCDTSNASYFVDNTGGATIELDGFTVPLTALAVVVPCQTYHLRISIADAGDGGWDSSVFFEAGSLSSTPVVDAGIDRAFCGAGSASIGFPGAQGWTYTWSPSAGLSSATDPNPTVTVSGTTASLTSYVLTASNGTCVLRDTVVVAVSPPPVASFTVSDVCEGNTVPIAYTGTAVAGAVYSWNFGGGNVVSGSGGGPYTVSYPATGNYSVTLQVNVGTCTSTAPAQSVNIFPVPVNPLATVDDVSCNGAGDGAINLVAQGGTPPFQFAWSPGVSTAASATGLIPGNYSVTLTDANGCTITSAYAITEPVVLTATSTGTPPLCAGSPSGSVTALPQGGTPPYHYQWTSTGDTASTLTNLSAGDYTCIITDDNGCTVSVTANVAAQIVVVPVVQALPTAVCAGEPVLLSVSGGVSYSWSDGPTDSVRTITPASSGTYAVVVTDVNGCTGTDSVDVQVAPEPQALFTFPSMCHGSASDITQQSTVASGNIQSYAWSFGDGTTASSAQPQHTYAQTGTYPVELVVTTDVGCVDTFITQTVVHPLPVASWTSDYPAGCIPWPVNFQPQPPSGSPTYATYQWSIGGTVTNESAPAVVFEVPGDYSVTLSIVDVNGCPDDTTLADYVHAYPLPEAGFAISPSSVTEFMPRVELNDASSGAVQWFWDFGDTTTSADREPVHMYAYPGIYTVRQVVVNNYGCIDTLVRILEVGRDYAFWIPNAFTPNGDGSNDVFEVKGYNFFDYRIEIFNRWGKQVFISENATRSWDGTQRGETAQEGVYDYVVDYNDVFGNPHRLYGRVTLIR